MSGTDQHQSRPPNASSRKVMVRFVVGFVLLLATFHFIASTSWFKSNVSGSMAHLNCKAAAALLQLGGHKEVVADGPSISSRKGGIVLSTATGGVDPTFLFLAAVLAFPARLRSRILAALAGTITLALLNLGRIIALYHAQISDSSHGPARLAAMLHWLFILIALLMWIAWAWRTMRPATKKETAP